MLRTIYVNPEAWAEASEAAQAEYISVAQSRGVELKFDVGEAGDSDTLITVSDDMHTDTALYDGLNACGRPPWEHRLRLLLDLSDPCFMGLN